MPQDTRGVSLGWTLLSVSGLMFVLIGIPFTVLWRPSSGPYQIGVNYPFGGYLEAFQVSSGFGFLAFGIVVLGVSSVARRLNSRRLWLVLLLSWALTVFPHAVIGAAFLLDNPSIVVSELPLTVVVTIWMGTGLLGFILTGKSPAPA